MKQFKFKTKEEIETEIKRAEEFVKEHPNSIFGDDNVKHFEMFKGICYEYLNGKSLDVLEEENNADADDEEEDSGNCEGTGYAEEENRYIDDIINWLRGETDEYFW